MQQVTLFIGSDNNTKTLELNTIKTILSEQHDGFTLSRATGFYKGKPEETAVVRITDQNEKILETVERLKDELQQECIGVEYGSPLVFL